MLVQHGTGLASALVLLFAGLSVWCSATLGAQPEYQVTGEGKLESYDKVYLAQIKKDVSKIYPKLLARLQKCGLEVVELKPENLPFTSQGSGFLIDADGDALTCAHVVGKEAKATLWVGGVRYLARVVAIDTNLDVALVRVEGDHPPFQPLDFGTNSACRLGEEVYGMGFPLANLLGTGAHISKGLVSAESGMQGETNHVEISAEVQPGNSGGPLLNAQGQVVGMISATINPMRVLVETGGSLPQNVNFAIKGPLLLRFLAKAGATLPATNSATKANFEETSKSLVLIRGGIVDEQRLREKPLVCTCTYFEGLRHQFLGLRILFVDVKAFRGVVRADLVKVTGRSMDSDLDHIFKEICAKALTDRDNPFDPKKRK